MPTGTSDLERIAALAERLAPLARKARGMRIEAEEWNTLVETLRGILEIDRAQEQAVTIDLDQNFARKVHEHVGEVKADWLDPALRAGLGGETNPVATRAAIADIDTKVSSL